MEPMPNTRIYGVHREDEARKMRNFFATALTNTAEPFLTPNLILGARSEYQVAEKN
jgi:hypothetical protein